MIIKEFERWINTGRPTVWVKGEEDDRWDTMRAPCWNSSGLVYIVDDEQAELRKLQVDKPDAKFQWYNEVAKEWQTIQDLNWDFNPDVKYRLKPAEWYEDPRMIGKPVWVRNQETDSWKIRIFKKYKIHRFFTEANTIETDIGWIYAKPVKPEDLYQGVYDDR